MERRDDRELRVLLADLEETLDDLRRELDEDGTGGRSQRRPPTVGELLQFTEEYTIPTTIAVLEATVAALELLQGLLGLARPGDRASRGLDSVGDAGDVAVGGLERTLSELRRALREVDLPDDAETRDVVQEARSLTETVERRIDESGRAPRSERGVGIEVETEERAQNTGEETQHDAVEAELREIREELDDQDAT